jgi:hypothetical protein
MGHFALHSSKRSDMLSPVILSLKFFGARRVPLRIPCALRRHLADVSKAAPCIVEEVLMKRILFKKRSTLLEALPSYHSINLSTLIG